jgi:putative SOS response-associated peptidase YedK
VGLETFTVVTTSANADMESIHDRMPVLLNPGALRVWLDPTSTPVSLQSVIQPSPMATLVRYRVSTIVNSARNDGPACIEPFDEPPSAEGFLPLG